MRKIIAVLGSLFLLTAWSLPEAHDQANKTLVEVGNWCSGTIVDKTKGYVVTANHCTNKKFKQNKTVRRDGVTWKYTYSYYDPITITQRKFNWFGEEIGVVTYKTVVYRVDAKHDTAVLLNVSGVPFDNEVKINTNAVSFGDKIYTLANPFLLPGVVAEGTVVHPKIMLDTGGGKVPLIGFDALVAPGSSGGGLFNDNGELIGLTNQGFLGTRLMLASPIVNMVELLK